MLPPEALATSAHDIPFVNIHCTTSACCCFVRVRYPSAARTVQVAGRTFPALDAATGVPMSKVSRRQCARICLLAFRTPPEMWVASADRLRPCSSPT